MKAIFTAVFIVISSTVMAAPKIGDTAKYTGLAQGVEFSSEVKVTKYNSTKKTYTVTESTTVQGQVKVESSDVEASEIVTPEQATALIAKCDSEEIGGELETVTTLAGTFTTCLIADQEGNLVNIAAVPFGFVKLTSEHIQMELVSFKKGN